MTDIARARAILTAVHDRGSYAVLGDWLVEESEGCTCGTSGIGGHEPGCGAIPLTNDPFITLMVDLYPAIDALLVSAERNGPGTAAVWYGEGFAAAILAWAERTGYEV